MIDVNSNLPLRRSLFGGYRRSDVEVVLAEMRLTSRWLQTQVEAARDRVREVESELAAVRNELEALRARENELAQAMSSAHRRAAEIEEAADARARAIVADAEQQAARIGAEVERRTDEARVRLDELLSLKDGLVQTLRSVSRDFDAVVGRIERGESVGGQQPQPPVETAPPRPAAPELPVPAPPSSPLSTFVVPSYVPEQAPPAAAAEAAGDTSLFDARVELDAGPFSDFAALSAFERALGRLPRVEDVYVRRFAGDRAVIELTMAEPGPLLQSLRDNLPYSVSVESADRDRLFLTVHASSAATAS